MGVQYNMTGVPQETLQGRKLQIALGMGIPELTQIANSKRTVNGVDSLTAVMALQIKGPAEKARRQQQAANQPPTQTVRDQVVAQAQTAPENIGIGAINAGNLMDEKAMAAGGIVAFQGGGTIEDLTKELNELKRQRQEVVGSSNVGGFRRPAAFTPSTAALDAKITALENRLRLEQTRSGFVGVDSSGSPLERDWSGRRQLVEQGITPAEFGTPPDLLQAQQEQQQRQQGQQGQQRQQPPGAAFPSGGSLPNQSQAYADLASRLKAGYAAADEGAVAAQMLGDPMARARFGYTADELSKLYDPQAKLLEGLPATREAAREEIEKRYAGLKDIDERRRSRAEALLKEAEKESGRDIGIGLAGLGFKIATARPGTNQMQEAIDTGLQYITSAKKDLKAARKDYAKSQDLLDEAQALREVGKEKEADEKFNDALNKRMNFQNAFTNAQVTNEAAIRSGIGQAAGRQVSRQLEGLSAELNLSAEGLKSEATRAYRAADIAKDYGVAGMYAASRLGGTDKYTYGQAKDDAQQFIKNNPMAIQKQFGKAPFQMTPTELQNVEDTLIRSYLQSRSSLQSGAAAPSGGGATGLDMSQWGDPRVKN